MGTPRPTVLTESVYGSDNNQPNESAISQTTSIDSAIYKLEMMTGTNDLREAVRRANEAQSRVDDLGKLYYRSIEYYLTSYSRPNLGTAETATCTSDVGLRSVCSPTYHGTNYAYGYRP